MTIKGFIKPCELENAVYRKLRSVGIKKEDYPINPYKLIENEGIILQEINLDNENIRGMLVHGPNVSGIVINANRSYVSKRFIATHELMHYWFHPKKHKRICFEEYVYQTKGIEWQANNAAAYALMPRDIVLDLYDYYNGAKEPIADWLKVSVESLTYRLDELGLKTGSEKFYTPTSFFESDPTLIAWESSWLYGGL